jgi:hypothetical protein
MIRQMAFQVTDGLQQRGRHAEPMLGSFGCPGDRGGTGPVTGGGTDASGHAQGAESGHGAHDEERP